MATRSDFIFKDNANANNSEFAFASSPGNALINADWVALPEAQNTSLLDFLRDQLQLTSIKPACRTGDCGACQILVGEIAQGETTSRYRALNSCLLTTAQIINCHVISSEGLSGSELSLIQSSLLQQGAVQCGYCSPGMVVAMTGALLNNTPFTQALAGNLCRCTGYAAVCRACARLEEKLDSGPFSLRQLADMGVIRQDVAQAAEQLKPIPREELSLPGSRAIVAGETDWAVHHPHHRNQSDGFLQLRHIPELRTVSVRENCLSVGAAVTISELQAHELIQAHLPQFAAYLDRFAALPIRNGATVGGNLINASPVADLAVLLLALDAAVVVKTETGIKSEALQRFYQGYHDIALEKGELLTEVQFNMPPPNTCLYFEKTSKRTVDDIATVNSALLCSPISSGAFNFFISAGGVAPFPLRLHQLEARLNGQPLTAPLIKSALTDIDKEISPISDVRGSQRYKIPLLQHQLIAHFCQLIPSLEWQECIA